MFKEEKRKVLWTFLEVQWLRLLTPNAGGMGSIPHQETKILHALGEAKKKKANKKESLVCPQLKLPSAVTQ